MKQGVRPPGSLVSSPSMCLSRYKQPWLPGSHQWRSKKAREGKESAEERRPNAVRLCAQSASFANRRLQSETVTFAVSLIDEDDDDGEADEGVE